MKINTLLLAVGFLAGISLLAACNSTTSEATPSTPLTTEAPPVAPGNEEQAPGAEPLSEHQVAGSVSFTKDVQPILEQACTSCHVTGRPVGSLDLTSYEGVMAGGTSGPSVIPGDPAASLLIQLIENGRMPMTGNKLSSDQMKTLRDWVSQGAVNN